MSKKKVFKPSKYQEAIFQFVKSGVGNAVVEAVAGSGKTSTLIKSIELVPENRKVLVLAFNKDIKTELDGKLGGHVNVKVKTLHSLGFEVIRMNVQHDMKINEFKYQCYIRENARGLSDMDKPMTAGVYSNYIKNIKSFIDLGRVYLSQTVKDLTYIEDKYAIETVADEKEVALKCMEWGKTHLTEIDYTDMVWLPNVNGYDTKWLKFDNIFVDECQDLNAAQLSLALSCRKINTRMLFFGDESQCIYGFSGADPESFNKIRRIPNTILLPLSITYRCAKNIVEYAKNYTKTIEASDTAVDGEVVKDDTLESVNDGDMILCRNNAPLMACYNMLVSRGKKAYILGKDIGENMIREVENTGETMLCRSLKQKGVISELYLKMFKNRDNIVRMYHITPQEALEHPAVASAIDMITAIVNISEGCKTSEQLIGKIGKVFRSKAKRGIQLSTIHKAKGLEADNVFIVCDSLFDKKKKSGKGQRWELTQEQNLRYVAYTRPKLKLSFIDERFFNSKDADTGESKTMNLKGVEEVIYTLYNRQRMTVDTIEEARDIVATAKDIKVFKSKTNIVTMPSLNGKADDAKEEGSLKSLMPRRKVRKRK